MSDSDSNAPVQGTRQLNPPVRGTRQLNPPVRVPRQLNQSITSETILRALQKIDTEIAASYTLNTLYMQPFQLNNLNSLLVQRATMVTFLDVLGVKAPDAPRNHFGVPPHPFGGPAAHDGIPRAGNGTWGMWPGTSLQ
jgi:hypothetical protein